MAPRFSKNRVSGDYTRTRSSDNINFTHFSLIEVAAIERYSTLVEDRATIHCFVELHEIGLAPRNMRKAPMEVRSSGLPAQSASEKPCNV